WGVSAASPSQRRFQRSSHRTVYSHWLATRSDIPSGAASGSTWTHSDTDCLAWAVDRGAPRAKSRHDNTGDIRGMTTDLSASPIAGIEACAGPMTAALACGSRAFFTPVSAQKRAQEAPGAMAVEAGE